MKIEDGTPSEEWGFIQPGATVKIWQREYDEGVPFFVSDPYTVIARNAVGIFATSKHGTEEFIPWSVIGLVRKVGDDERE